MTSVIDAARARYQRALDAKPSKGAYTADGIAALTDSVCDVPLLLDEIERLHARRGFDDALHRRLADPEVRAGYDASRIERSKREVSADFVRADVLERGIRERIAAEIHGLLEQIEPGSTVHAAGVADLIISAEQIARGDSGMSETPERIRSGPGADGLRSPHTYTRAEIAAGKRRGLVRGKESMDSLGGPLFWAAGDYYSSEVAQAAADYALLAEAIKREWGGPWPT
ncbi:hypothetical protein GCM10009785_13740 [Brooklawnia cerclae]|uniref:DUF222 domain-containing protein n=1 Tax=Brooklawnia cerclae TaxID=349934 RepID=A0ABX0SKJ7_9ACTN|nr:hypothetical protein [Brooklawnia cerclae]NIH58510.1 hypothetical protein [Brooklawnia cerclae]